jgi:anti-sigma factor RsiW
MALAEEARVELMRLCDGELPEGRAAAVARRCREDPEAAAYARRSRSTARSCAPRSRRGRRDRGGPCSVGRRLRRSAATRGLGPVAAFRAAARGLRPRGGAGGGGVVVAERRTAGVAAQAAAAARAQDRQLMAAASTRRSTAKCPGGR